MALHVTKKAEVVKKYQRDAKDTGSPEVQIALLSANIEALSAHLQIHKKDLHSRRGLIKMVNTRRKLSTYLKRTNYASYLKLIQELGLRK
jgi:small subunit ribosomal protein S15